MTSPKRSGRRNLEWTPTREEMDADVSIPALFEEVMLAVTDGCGTFFTWAPFRIAPYCCGP